MRLACIILLACWVLTGCGGGTGSGGMGPGAPAGSGATPSKETGPIVTPSETVSGRVSFVNVEARYVVVTFPLGVLPAIGQKLDVYRDGLKVGEIKVSGPHRDNNTVADLVAGEGRKGDEVRGH